MPKYVVYRTVHFRTEIEAESGEAAVLKASALEEEDFESFDEDEMTAELADEE